MISSLRLSMFKAFAEPTTIDLSDITLLYGANSAGKSSLIHALLLMKQSFQQTRLRGDDNLLDFKGPLIDLGGFNAAVRDHDTQQSMTLGLTVATPSGGRRPPSMRRQPFGDTVSFDFTFSYDESSRKPKLTEILLRGAGQEISFKQIRRKEIVDLFLTDGAVAKTLFDMWMQWNNERPRTQRAPLPELLPDEQKRVIEWLRTTPLSRQSIIPTWDPSLLRSVGRPVGGRLDSPRRQVITEILFDWRLWASNLERLLVDSLEKVKYVGPLREAPKRISVEVASPSFELGPKGERALRLLSADPTLLNTVNEMLSQLEVNYELKISEIGVSGEEQALGEVSILFLRDKRTGLLTTLSDVGFGMSQLIPVVIQLVLPSDSLIVIEQPELHLHPRLQARLVDVILYSINRQRNRVLLETHSEHLLIRLQRRIKEELLNADQLLVCYVGSSQGAGSLSEVQLNQQGDLVDTWPAGFFDDRLEDLLANISSAEVGSEFGVHSD